MANRYKYRNKNGYMVVIDTESNNETVLSNFTAKIVKMMKYVFDDVSDMHYYYIEGKTQNGDELKPINQLSEEDYKKGDWLLEHWGNKVNLNSQNDQQYEELLKHLLRAVVRLSRPILIETVYEQTGMITDSSNETKFIFGNGAITAKGIDPTSYCELPDQLNFYQLPELLLVNEEINVAIKHVFNLLLFSEKNPNLGLLLCLSAIRATISMWLPIEHFFFLVNRHGNFKDNNSEIMQVIQSFFGVTNQQTPLLSWTSSVKELTGFARTANNGILCVDDFNYPDISNRRHDFAVKAEEFLRAVSKGSEITAEPGHVSIDDNPSINCLVISAGEFPPRNFPKSFPEQGIYVPVNSGDIDLNELKRLQSIAEDGTFAHVNVAFIQYLLSDYEKNSALGKKRFEQAIETNKSKLELTDCAARHMAALQVGWRFFLDFAVSKLGIEETDSRNYFKFVNEHLGSLMQQQKEISSSYPGQLFIKGLKRALKDGKAYLIDSKTGLQPTNIAPTKVGWGDKKPKGLRIGWRDDITGEVFLRGDLPTKEFIKLLPENHQAYFSDGKTKFWKDLNTQDMLKCPEEDRNTTRQVLANSLTSNNYHLNMVILRTLKSNDLNNSKSNTKNN